MYAGAVHKFSTQTVDSSQVLAKCIRQEQQQIIKSITKNWDKNRVKELEQVCLKQRQRPPFNVLIVKDNFIKTDNVSVIRHLVLNAQSS